MFHYVESKVGTSHGTALLSYMCVYPVRLSLYGTFNFLCAALLRSFICKSLKCSTKAKAKAEGKWKMENGKWGKTAIKKVAAPAYASSLRCRILKCPCELSTGFSPHNPAKKPVRRGGRPDPDADDVGGGGGVSMSSLTTRGMDPRMLYGVVVIILAVVVVVVVVAIGTVLLFRLVLALLYYNSALSIP